MITTIGKGWLAGLTLILAIVMMTAQAADQETVLYEAAPAKAVQPQGGTLVAKAGLTKPGAGSKADEYAVTVPDSVPIVAVSDNLTTGVARTEKGAEVPEKIEMNLVGGDKNDPLTREAMDKLDVQVESLEFANADLRNVIRIIGDKLNINFIFDSDNIGGKVTLRLRNIRLRDALTSILTTRKLAIIADRSGIFRIVPQEQVGRKGVETKTEVIQLKWISAIDVQKTMKPFMSDDGKMEANEESNCIIVTDVPPQIETLRKLIDQIDTAERQVQIEARLADVNIEAIRNLGTKWSLSKPSDFAAKPAAGADPLPTAIGGLVPILVNGFANNSGQGTLQLGEKVGIFGGDYDLNAVFSALEERKLAEVLANPRVTTLNNVPASISIIQKIPYIQASGLTSSGTQVPTVTFADAGVDIKVKPIITPNGFVRMDITLKQMIFRGRVGAEPLDPPLIDERNADTNVIVESDNTAVLGGLRQQQQISSISGVPWLHEIPFFGWLFKNKTDDRTKIELVLMMTPRIIKSHMGLTDKEKYWYDKIDTDWHLPDYFFDDVSFEKK